MNTANRDVKKPLMSRIRHFLRSCLPRSKQRIEMPVFHRDDMESLLEQIGLSEDFKKGKLRCNSCGEVVTKENLQCIFSEKAKIKLLCSNLMCHSVVLKKTSRENEG